MQNSAIEWKTHSWSPWYGCTEVSPGCEHCYAKTMMDTRYGRVKWGLGQPRQRTSEPYWRQPLRWNREAQGWTDFSKRPRVFPSLCDPFDAEVPEEWKDRFWDLVEETANLDWLILTKRSARMLKEITDRYRDNPPGNVWLGVSVENQEWADRRLESFREVPCTGFKFVSYEPAIGPVNWSGWEFLNWVIVGGESGPGARRFESSWAEESIRWCRDNGVACFIKQKGANSDIACKDRKGGDPQEWPEWCRVREFPVPGRSYLVHEVSP